MRMNRRDFIKTTGVLGACACCGLPGAGQIIGPYKSKSELPTKFNMEPCTLCQLNCPACQPRKWLTENGRLGYLKFKDFKRFVNENKVTHINFACQGELFLNPELLDIIKYAHKKNILLRCDTGVNGNDISDDVAEALVKCKFQDLTFSIDGASREIYSIYRVGGDFDKVIDNIKKINALKAKYNSEFPKITWKYIVFGHNVCDMAKAKQMAEELGISFLYADNCEPEYSPVKQKDAAYVKKMTAPYRFFGDYMVIPKIQQAIGCIPLFNQPHINHDGRLLGCFCNLKGYTSNVFKPDLMTALNDKEMIYSKNMITGQIPENIDNPCFWCGAYKYMKQTGVWVDPSCI